MNNLQQTKYIVQLLLDHEDMVEVVVYAFNPETAGETAKSAFEFDDHIAQVIAVWEDLV